jgi:hypothetical protein
MLRSIPNFLTFAVITLNRVKMKNLIKFCAVILLVFIGCKNEKGMKNTKQEARLEIQSFDSFGVKITKDAALNSDEMLMKFNTMKVGDTAIVKFSSKIKEVCSKKGCWMKLPLGDSSETMVRFKDYGFFMPLDAKDREVILEGKAFVQETSIKELKHYAKDAGKSEEEIAKIIAPKKEFTFEANGVLMKK